MTRRNIDVAAQAARDIGGIYRASRRHFGESAAIRYRGLILAGIEILADEPAQKTVRTHADLRDGAATYHLRHVRQLGPDKVGSPRHLIVFTFDAENILILRVLHDAMDLPRHILKR